MDFESQRLRLQSRLQLQPDGQPGLRVGPGAAIRLDDAAAFIRDELDSSALLQMLFGASAGAVPGDPLPVALPSTGLMLDALTLLPPLDGGPSQLSLELVWQADAPPVTLAAMSDLGMHFTLTQIRASVEITGPHVHVGLAARLGFNGLELDLAAQLPACVFEASLGPPDPGQAQVHQQLIGSFLPAPPAEPGHAGAVELKGLNLMLALRQPSVMLHFAVENLFTLAPFRLGEVQVDINYVAGSKSGRLWTDLFIDLGKDVDGDDLPPIELVLLAELDPSGGWQFEGRTGAGSVRLADFLRALGGTGDMVLPRAISSLEIAELSLKYGTLEHRFDFVVEVRLTVEDTAVDVAISLSRQTGSSSATGLQAVARIGPYEFDLDLARTSQPNVAGETDWESSLIALYKCVPEQTSKPPDLHEMVEYLSPGLARIVPSITIPKAVFGYHSKRHDGSIETAWLFGVQLGLDMDFSVGDLPVVSALFGKDLRFGLDSLQILLTTHALSQHVLAQLPHLDDFALPTGDLNKACISARMHLGADPYPLMLELDASPDPADAAPAGGAVAAAVPAGSAATPAIAAAPALASTMASEPVPAAAPAPFPATATATATATAAAAAAPAPAPAAGDATWIPIHKQISLLYVDKVGLRYHDGKLGVLVSASLTASGLTLSLQGLSIESPLSEFKPVFGLDGLGLAYQGGPVKVSGAFSRNTVNGVVQYSGEASVQAASFTLSAIGSYACVQGSPSLFAYAFLDKPLGGPACFFVTGLAAGFGYNRSLRIPLIDQVPAFPLVSAVMAGESGKNPFAGMDGDPSQAISVLADYVAPSVGENWLAVGVRFTSFKVVQSFALVTVTFGASVEFSLLGLSTLTMPAQLPKGAEPIGLAQMALRVTYSPGRGVFCADAKLTGESHILSKDCHLTGGFAFYIWFRDQDHGVRAGDFALTLGGYHPRYQKPAHYPAAAAVGFNWQIDDLTIKGGMYFALTPSAVMAGGYLDAVWQSGGIRAWFQAYADFLLSWKPLHYDARVGLQIGASFTVDLLLTSFTMTIHVGVDLQLQGPPFGGKATIDLSVISFTIPFGSDPTPRAAITWAEFKASFLPAVLARPLGPGAPDAGLPAVYKGAVATDSYCFARFAAGLVQSPGDKGDGPDDLSWVVNGSSFELVVQSLIPIRTAILWLDGWSSAVALHDDSEAEPAWQVDVGPMDLPAASFTSELFVAVHRKSGKDGSFKDCVKVRQLLGGVPQSIWSAKSALHTDGGSIAALNADPAGSLIASRIGFSFTPHIVADRTPLAIEARRLQAEIMKVPAQACFRSKPDLPVHHAGAADMAPSKDETLRRSILAILAEPLGIDAGAAVSQVPAALLRHPSRLCLLGEAA